MTVLKRWNGTAWEAVGTGGTGFVPLAKWQYRAFGQQVSELDQYLNTAVYAGGAPGTVVVPTAIWDAEVSVGTPKSCVRVPPGAYNVQVYYSWVGGGAFGPMPDPATGVNVYVYPLYRSGTVQHDYSINDETTHGADEFTWVTTVENYLLVEVMLPVATPSGKPQIEIVVTKLLGNEAGGAGGSVDLTNYTGEIVSLNASVDAIITGAHNEVTDTSSYIDLDSSGTYLGATLTNTDVTIIADRAINLNAPTVKINGDVLTAGGAGEKLYFTVATAGVIPPAYGTPAPLAASADFVGNGSHDEIAIQAAIDAVVDFVVQGTGLTPDVLLLPGIYGLASAINTKGVTIIMSQNAILASLGSNRIISNGPDAVILRNGNLSNAFGGGGAACIYGTGTMQLINCQIASIGSGSDRAVVEANGSSLFVENTEISSYASNSYATYSSLRSRITNSHIQGAVWLNGADLSLIEGNQLAGGGDGAVQLNDCDNCLVTGNNFYFTMNDSILLDNSSRNTITSNNIENPGGVGGSATADGIHLRNTSSRNNVQLNSIYMSVNGRYNINVETSDCDGNFVTNNDMHENGPSGTLNDGGTNTHTTSGNFT